MQHPPANAAEAGEHIFRLTGIRRKPTQIRTFLRRLGMAPRKVASIPAKADVEAQRQFKEQVLEPRLEEAKTGKRAVYFVDASHFVLSAFLGILWCFTRLFLKAPSGRQRFNVLGALHAVRKTMVTVCNDTYITSTEVCQLLDQLAALHRSTPVSVVLDNASYQRCRLVQDHAKRLKIELLFLPSYSPNLNLIERFWKYVKKNCLYNRYYPNFAEFKNAISACIRKAPVRDRKTLRSLLTLRFQTFQPSVVAAA